MTEPTSTNKHPLVTVLMPVYNAEEFVETAIQSILEQTYKNFELLIMDDGSTDDSAAIILAIDDSRISYIKNDVNLKLITTLNKGLKLAKGKYIARLDADDIAEKTRLQEQVDFMEANPKVGLSGTWYTAFGTKNSTVKNPTQNQDIRYMALYQCPIIHPSTIFRTSVIRDNNLSYNMDYPHAEDYELWCRFAQVSELANIPSILLKYRLHETNVSKLENPTQAANTLRIKTELFENIGVAVTPEELKLFERLNHHVVDFSESDLVQLGRFLTKLVLANNSSSYLEPAYLTQLLKRKWYETCSNHYFLGWKSWKIYWNEPQISASSSFNIGSLKLLIKSIRGQFS
ncbi:glycosyltransferase [Flavobacteriales bacterium]|nr:glycosyltransferase [Flavobacteriales bacterium]